MLPISKTTFLQFQICPKDTWLRLHKPELLEKFVPTEFEKHLFEQGNEVEEQARGSCLRMECLSLQLMTKPSKKPGG